MIIHQAFYGEVNRGHACINQTLNNPDLTSFLIAFTDRPAALPPGIDLQPYISGTAWSNYYIFSKTYSDPYATRSGMVFTHALIIKLDNVKLINNLNEIFCNFIDSVPENKSNLQNIEIDTSSQFPTTINKQQPAYIKECVNALLKNKLPILFTGDLKSFVNVIQKIWDAPNLELRKKIKYRASFSPSDIESSKELTIVLIQKEFITKWSERTLIDGENKDEIDINSHSELLFLGAKENNPFFSFLQELNVDQSNYSNYGLLDNVFNDFNEIGNIDDANRIRQNIRILSLVSPSKNDGVAIKDKFLERLISLINSEKERNYKALRNITWESFNNGEQIISQVLTNYVESELKKSSAIISNLSELFELAFFEKNQNWWHNTIINTLRNIFTSSTRIVVENLWKLVNQSEKYVDNIFNLTPNSNDFQIALRNLLPEDINELAINKLENIFILKKWYLLHADILLKYLSPQDAIIKQLIIEKHLTFEKANGVKYLVEKLNDNELVSLTLSTCNNKLIQLSANRIIQNNVVLNNLDLKKKCWIEIWELSLYSSNDFSFGIEGREPEIAFSVLDLITSQKSVPEIIIKCLSESTFTDISNYENRSKCWSVIAPRYLMNFLDNTSKSVLKQYVNDEISLDSIERPLVDHISSDSFMSGFLSENRSNIVPVIKVYESLSNLKDSVLADYVLYFNKTISQNESQKLGELVLKNHYTLSAQKIYEKSKYNNSFTLAFEKCRSLVKLSWWSELWNEHKYSKGSRNWDNQEVEKENNFNMIKKLPTIVILTAIQEEYLAVREHLSAIEDADQKNTSYEAGIFVFNEKPIAKVIIRECGPKNTNASQETERAIQNFTPDCILFVGIAGSRKPKDFAVGDVIFPEKIYSYEGGKSEKKSFRARPDFADTDYSMRELSKKERIKGNWKTLIKGDWPNEVKADIGIIASGEQVVEHYNSEVGQILTEHYNDASVVEMEGFGFAKAANRQGRQYKNMIVGVVRGISDIIGQPDDMQENTNADKRPANVKNFASDTAAAFAYWLIYKTFDN